MRRLALTISAALLTITAVALDTAPASAATRTILTGTGDGAEHRVRSFDSNGNLVGDQMATRNDVPPNGVRVAVGDVNGDGNDDTITASGPGAPSSVTVFPGTASFTFAAFAPYGDFRGGVNVAAGDVDGDGRDEIVTAADTGGGPHVRVWDVDGQTQISEKHGWMAYDPGFRGGVSVAVAQVVGTSRAEVITGPGPGGGPHVKVFEVSSSSARETRGWFAYTPGFGGGVNVAAGSVDGVAVVVTGAGGGGGPHVRSWNPSTAAEQVGFFAYAPGFGGGVNVAVGDADADGRGEIVTAPASGGGPHVRTFEGNGAPSKPEFFAYEPSMTAGVHLATFPRASQNSGSSSNTGGNP